MKSSLLACAWASLIATQAAAASPRLELSPTSKWDMDYGLERCSLARQFGSGDAAALLRIDSFGYWNEFRVLITGPAVPPFNTPAGSVFVTRTGDPEAVEAPSLQGKAGDHPAVSFSLDFAPYVSRETLKRLNKEERDKRELEMYRPYPEYDAALDASTVRARGPTLLVKTG
jgi:hypothetical protein